MIAAQAGVHNRLRFRALWSTPLLLRRRAEWRTRLSRLRYACRMRRIIPFMVLAVLAGPAHGITDYPARLRAVMAARQMPLPPEVGTR